MLLALDVGNSTIGVYLYQRPVTAESEPVRGWQLRADPRMTGDEIMLLVDGLLGPLRAQTTAAVVSSTLPSLRDELRRVGSRTFATAEFVLVEPGVKTGAALRVDSPNQVGTDRVMNAVAVRALHPGAPVIVIDAGTTTKIDAIAADGTFLGGAIAPGLSTTADALAVRTPALPRVDLVAPPSVVGKNTTNALQSGLIFGFAAMIEGMVARIAAVDPELIDPGAVVLVATGGAAEVIAAATTLRTRRRGDLTALGMGLTFERVRAARAARHHAPDAGIGSGRVRR